MKSCSPSRPICILLLSACLTSGASGQEQRAIDDVLQESLALALAPGAVVAVVAGDSIAFLTAQGRTGPNEAAGALPPDAVFRAGALTMLVNGVAAAHLEFLQPGVLSRPLGAAIPELPRELQSLTLEQLLTHTAGLTYEVAVPGRAGADDPAAAARQLTALDRMTDGGVLYSVSTQGASLAGLALERLSGVRYARLLDSLVFAPLAMHHSSVSAESDSGIVTPGYQPSEGAENPMELIAPKREGALSAPVNGLRSNATDVARLAAALVSRGVVNGSPALPAEVVSIVLRPRTLIPGSIDGVGLGVRVSRWMDRPVIRVSGGHAGHAVVLRALPNERIAVVAFANKGDAVLHNVAEFVFRRLLNLPNDSPPVVSAGEQVTMEKIAAAAGVYANGGERLEIQVDDGRPILRSQDLLFDLRPLPNGAIGAVLNDRVVLVFRIVRGVLTEPYLWLTDRAFVPIESPESGGT